jgi:hypothetical protein
MPRDQCSTLKPLSCPLSTGRSRQQSFTFPPPRRLDTSLRKAVPRACGRDSAPPAQTVQSDIDIHLESHFLACLQVAAVDRHSNSSPPTP